MAWKFSRITGAGIREFAGYQVVRVVRGVYSPGVIELIESSGFLLTELLSCNPCWRVVEVGVAEDEVEVVTSWACDNGPYIPASSSSFSSFCCCCCCCCCWSWWLTATWEWWWVGGLLEESSLCRWPPGGKRSPAWCPPWSPSITWILWTLPPPPRGPPKSEKIGSSNGPPSIVKCSPSSFSFLPSTRDCVVCVGFSIPGQIGWRWFLRVPGYGYNRHGAAVTIKLVKSNYAKMWMIANDET